MEIQKRSLFNLWKPVTKDEIWVYIAVLGIMGIIGKPQIHMYWTKDCFFSTPIFSRLMRRDRFEQIRKMIHFTCPENEDIEDPLHKLSSFIDLLQQRFQQVYTPEQNVAVDEYLSLWKGRLKFRVYIPTNENDTVSRFTCYVRVRQPTYTALLFMPAQELTMLTQEFYFQNHFLIILCIPKLWCRCWRVYTIKVIV